MSGLTASADIHGRAIDLALTWSDPPQRARSLRVVRRRSAYPTGPQDGLVLADLESLFASTAVPWGRIERERYLLVNTLAEGGLLQAELVRYHASASDAQPTQVTVFVYGASLPTAPITSVTRIVTTVGATPVFGRVTTLEVFTQVSPGPEISAGIAVISTQATDGSSPSFFTWTQGATQTSAQFVLQETQSTLGAALTGQKLTASFVTTMGTPAVTLRTIDFTEDVNGDTGDFIRSIAISDREPPTRAEQGFAPGLQPGVTYYYAAFEDLGGGLAAGTVWTSSSVATGRYGLSEALYELLPAVHRFYDDPAGEAQGTWQLRRFLQVFGSGLDQARSLGEGLSTLHDVFEVRSDYLPRLARMIGWETDRTLPTRRQRSDLLFAPEVFATVGTVPNIRAMVNRATGWDCDVKEFVNNVFLTNAPEPIRLWEVWEADSATGAFAASSPATPASVTRAVGDSIDARPAVVADPGGGAPWLFWHSDRPDPAGTIRRRIWMMQANGTDTPRPVLPDAGSTADQCPAVIADVIAGVNVIRLFWTSCRGGRSSLWTLTITGGVVGAAVRLTDHPAADEFPAAVREAGGRIWLFWQSSRRGPTDIWRMTLDPGATDWSPPQRVTRGAPRDGMPSALIDGANQLRLFWSADSGDQSRILQSIYNGTTWSSPPVDVSSGLPPAPTPSFRDEAPAAVLSAGSLWVFWHSNRDGITRLWASQGTGATWSPPFALTSGRSAEKDPSPFVAGGALRLFFRTQRGGELFRSRTVDFANVGAVKPGQADDRWHYTYSTTSTPTSYYARGAVGLYMRPREFQSNEEHQSEITRVKALVEPFRPLPVQFFWLLEPTILTEVVYGPVDIGETYTDNYPIVESLGAVGESYGVTLQGWTVINTNTLGDVTANPADLTTLRNRVFYPAPT